MKTRKQRRCPPPIPRTRAFENEDSDVDAEANQFTPVYLGPGKGMP
jgi:hypothetical protein